MLVNAHSWFRPVVTLVFVVALQACGGGGGGGTDVVAINPGPVGSADNPNPTPPAPAPAPPTPTPDPVQPPAAAPAPDALTAKQAARFLSQATFGPDQASIDALVASDIESWMLNEFDKPASLVLPTLLDKFDANGEFRSEPGFRQAELATQPSDMHWQIMVEGDDQLRQRMAFALSQILVISTKSELRLYPQKTAHYMDILSQGAFGNYRDLLEEITYSPAMSMYLTYLRNRKAHPTNGRLPDENYAREILQLFSVGLVALNADGTPVLNGDGSQRELYDNSDITELSKVFTGLTIAGYDFDAPRQSMPPITFAEPLEMDDRFHSPESKRVFGTTIPAGTPGEESIDMALDAIFDHPNVGPFVGRQLIQRFVTSAPDPAYVARVSAAFDAGSYILPSGKILGSGERGDLKVVLAAVLLDEAARSEEAALDDAAFGKLREPVLRFTHWARAFEVNSADASNQELLKDAGHPLALSQHAYQAPSVFNFYKPGYLAPRTQTGSAGLTVPELQITTSTTVVSYPNFISYYALGLVNELAEDNGQPMSFEADYSAQTALARDPQALLDNLDTLLTHGTLGTAARDRIVEAISLLPARDNEDLELRARLASVMVMTTPDYLVQR